MPRNQRHIAIVGLGPKGLYAFERLSAEIKAAGVEQALTIHLFNDNPYWGAGRNFRFDQANYLLINFNIGYVNMWPTTGPPPVVPDPLSLTDWLRRERYGEASVGERGFVSRAVVGAYLHAGWQAVIDHVPPNVAVRLHQTRVERLRRVGGHWRIVTQDEKPDLPDFEQVLLTTGHQRQRPGAYEQKCRRHCADRPGTAFVDYVYPTHERLRDVPAGAEVAVKGMGLTYVDTVLALTEGRGGRFEGSAQRGFTYRPGGREPKRIYPFSRSGLPMFPRGSTYGLPGLPLRYFTRKRIAGLVAEQGLLDWRRDLLPLLRADYYAAYYHHVFRVYGRRLPEEIRIGRLYREIAAFHAEFPREKVFHPQQLFDGPDRRATDHAGRLRYFQELCLAAAAGEQNHALAAAAAVWRYANPIFSEFYKFGGLKPDAQRTFLRDWSGNLNRLTYGMPLDNALKLVALAEAGILDFTYTCGPELRPGEVGGFELVMDGKVVHRVAALVDARIPKTSLERDANPLYRNLLRDGLIRPFVNRDENGNHFAPGCLDLTPQGAVLDARGRAHANLCVTGIPTEGVTFDNDTLSTQKNNFGNAWARRVAADLAAAVTPGSISLAV